VADVVLQLRKPLAFDPTASLEATGRFVIVDDFEIAGGGIIREGLNEDNRTSQGAGALDSLWANAPETPGTVVFLTGSGEAADAATELLRAKVAVFGPLKSNDVLDALGETLFHVATSGLTTVTRLDDLDAFDVERLNTRLQNVPVVWVSVADAGDAASIVKAVEAQLKK
jgi:hypothetical protein